MHTPRARVSASARSRARTRARSLVAAPLAALALVAAACSPANEEPAVDQSANGEAAGEPSAIVSLAPTTTEMLFAVGAGEQVVAVDERSDYPEDAPVTDLSGYTPNLEAILGYDPDLVVLSDDNGGIVDGLERAGVEVLLLPAAANLDDTYTQIEQVGAATGHVGEAAEVVSQMQVEIDEIVASVPERETPLTYFHELDDTFYTVTDDTYIGEIYSMLGMTSIATGDNPYPQLSEELILEDDPDVVLLADAQCCGVTPEIVAQRPGWDQMTAVREGHVYVVDEDLASRWGPRVVDFLREVAGLVSGIPAGTGADAPAGTGAGADAPADADAPAAQPTP